MSLKYEPASAARRAREPGAHRPGDRGLLARPRAPFSPGCEPLQILHRNVQRFRGGLAFKDHRLCVSLNSRLESNKEEKTKMNRAF